MSGGASARAEALRATCDLSNVGTVVDVGGGQGRLLAGLLAAVLFDRPEVVAGADEVLQTAGGRPLRCRRWGLLRCGPPGRGCLRPGADRPRLAGCGSARDLLHLCHRAMAPGARLWVIEQVLPLEDGPDPSERAGLTLLDLNMLVLFGGGQERTAEEYRQLLVAAGFDEVAVLPEEGTPWSVVEAVRR
jgi:orsellinic acid C2-O-methyltransferase